MRWILCLALLAVGGVANSEDAAVYSAMGDGITESALDGFFAKLKEDGEEPRLPKLSMDELFVGHVGTIPYDLQPKMPVPFVRTSILSVIDDNQQLVNVQVHSFVRSFSGPQAGKPSVSPEYLKHTKTLQVIVRGRDTSRSVDGQLVRFSGSWKVTGTESYSSVGGAKRTVYVIEPTTIRLPK